MSFDIIFVGGGATACITAGRLAEADPTLKILILEAGPHTRDVQTHVQPGRYLGNLVSGGETFSYHVANPSEAVRGRSLLVASGRAVGGGSSVNSMVYNRAAASDYDDWEKEFGNKGWGSDKLIPLLKKAETYQAPITNDTHGSSGPIKVSFAREGVNVAEDFLNLAGTLDKDRGTAEDINTFFVCNKYGKWARYIDRDSGKRSDTAHHYIYSQSHNENLTVMTRKRVVRVIFENKRATGVEFVDDTIGRKSGVSQQSSIARASRLVVLSTGTFGSPSVLERSGVGASNVLKKNNVPEVVNLPGVGENYMDHNCISTPYLASDDADTMDPLFRGTSEEIESFSAQWVKDGTGLMTHTGLDAGIKMRPNEQELQAMFPEFGHRWRTYFANKPDKPVLIMVPMTTYAGTDVNIPRGKYFTLCYFSCYPLAKGRVHITSASDPYARFSFDTGFLEDPADLVILRWAYKKGREISRRLKYYRGEVVSGHPQFPDGSQAIVLGPAEGPVDISSPDIIYSKEDDAAIDEYHRRTVGTTWHSLGTCAMKPREQGGVVDERLNVYGVENLKVADCSIAPANVGANTFNTAIAIGENAAVIIAEDLGIKGVSPA